jgi:Rod binding domain-containing protein
MNMQRQMKSVDSGKGLVLYAGLAWAIASLGAAGAADAIEKQVATAAAPAPQATSRAPAAARLDDRVKAVSTALDLDAAQQTQLRKILLEQRDAVRKIWSDKSLSPAERVPATRAAGTRAGDEIRAILNDEQKKKYNSATPTKPDEQGDKRSVEQWLDAARPR